MVNLRCTAYSNMGNILLEAVGLTYFVDGYEVKYYLFGMFYCRSKDSIFLFVLQYAYH